MSSNSQHSRSTAALFEPFTIGSLTLPTRIVMAPMTRGFSPNGVPGPDVAAYYRRRAENNVGLIITEGTVIDHPASTDSPNIPRFFGEDAMNGWAEVVKQVHEAGGKIMPQIWHIGMTRPVGAEPNPEAMPIGPSGLDLNGNQVSEPMTEEEIAYVIQAYADAAANAKRIGFDGVEIHGAHGYLIDQFLWERTNRRTDRYGGDMMKRARFAIEVVEAVRRAVGPDFPVVLRLSQWKTNQYDARLAPTPEDLGELLGALSDAGVDVFHCSTRRFWEPEYEGSDLNFAGWAKKLTGKPAITVGSVGLDEAFTSLFTEGKGAGSKDIDDLLERLENGEFDLVAVGRALLADPAWATKVREGRIDELAPFTAEALKTLV
ncbi:2,4-dienoyl-CoA reductase-like NADH-dependent reductase (Old Yellow Enzyme family) [Paenibacillus rhizosphaerae]|uniref:2,4-dienoyl-CoA reductase-like NADH-dependent reductase (Old Yellow Enzyme family) n=1 Tax=Paenibacillus rhizosphaerae TaxID=297318 RepID=A0A839TW16_9BACL|nr:NADH:flavin oxidoreductase [Paenibacillus rhizosphaerae]MBB3130701.1 2,4-dienoyl-CoA reductase-like NADH-dependent reductase (Old Yellow Enzyme family) [Paenibacillus rhizosphaerae]